MRKIPAFVDFMIVGVRGCHLGVSACPFDDIYTNLAKETDVIGQDMPTHLKDNPRYLS